jgi:hypothetical protein
MLRESVRLFWEVGHRPRLARSLCFLGIVTFHRGSHARGVRLLAAAESTNRFLRASIAPDERADLDASLTAARVALSEETFWQAWGEGQAMTLEQVVAYADDQVFPGAERPDG